MKKIAIGVVVTGGALHGLRRAMHHGHKLCAHRGGSLGCCHLDEVTPAAS